MIDMCRVHVSRRFLTLAAILSLIPLLLLIIMTRSAELLGLDGDQPSVSTRGEAASATSTESPTPRRGWWYAIGDRPTEAEVAAAPRWYSVVVLNAWDGWALKKIKAIDSTVKVLMYKDLSSSRVSADTDNLVNPTGVGYQEAESAGPSWFATDNVGHRVEWAPYQGHWQMAVWNSHYQERWARNVVREVTDGGWDGVLADNDFATLNYYSHALLAGTSTSAETNSKIRAGLDRLVEVAGSALRHRDKLFIPNISNSRLYSGRWWEHSKYGGAMEEHFVHWSTLPGTGFAWDWGARGWQAQCSEMNTPGLSLAITRSAPTDRRSQLYGYASMLVCGDATSYWSPSTTKDGDYSRPESIAEMSWSIGRALTPGARLASGVWTRSYEGAFVIVNPSNRRITVDVPPRFIDANGRVTTSVNVPSISAIMLRPH
jgi:hypothetical protein